MNYIKQRPLQLIRSILMTMGFLWLPMEAYEGLSNQELSIPFWVFITASLIFGVCFFFTDGFFLSGRLKKKFTLTNSNLDTVVNVEFGDIFTQQGWKAIAVNDFFDSTVDDKIISNKTLHGYVIETYWKNRNQAWQEEATQLLQGYTPTKEVRLNGNTHRYGVGTTVAMQAGEQSFLFAAIGVTDAKNHVTSANAEQLICGIRGMLRHAREVCSGEPLSLPLMGSGLLRAGVQNTILVSIILLAIQEESKVAKVTNKITLVLPEDQIGEIDLGVIKSNWNNHGK